MSRDLGRLEPRFRKKVQKFLWVAKWLGVPCIVTCTHRTFKKQRELYKIGRVSRVTKTVTNAHAGESPHNVYNKKTPASLAVDVVPGTKKAVDFNSDWKWTRVGWAFKVAGIDWGNKWNDKPHGQEKDWKQVARTMGFIPGARPLVRKCASQPSLLTEQVKPSETQT